MRVSKIPVPAGSGYPFLISISYLLRFYPRIPTGTNFFDIPNSNTPNTYALKETLIYKFMIYKANMLLKS